MIENRKIASLTPIPILSHIRLHRRMRNYDALRANELLDKAGTKTLEQNGSMMSLRILSPFLFCFLLVGQTQAKSWRGIVPLKSTRADVERLLGKVDSWGRYQFEDERGSIRYRENPCLGVYRPLEKDNCECMVSRDTVVSIFVTPEVTRTFSSLNLGRKPKPGPGLMRFLRICATLRNDQNSPSASGSNIRWR
jgi:hypothetical protein